MEKVKITVLGTTGFIGRHVKEALEHLAAPYELRWDGSSIPNADWVVNCIGLTDPKRAASDLAYANLMIPLRLLDTMRPHAKLIQLDTTDPTDNPYSRSKAAIREILREHPRVTTLRLGTVYGLGQSEHRFVARALAAAENGEAVLLDCDGSSVRNFTHVATVTSAIESVIKFPVVGGVVNVPGDKMSLIEAANVIWECVWPGELANIQAKCALRPAAAPGNSAWAWGNNGQWGGYLSALTLSDGVKRLRRQLEDCVW